MDTMEFRGPGFHMQVPTDWLIRATPQHQAIFIAPRQKDGSGANLVVDMLRVSKDFELQHVHALLEQSRKRLVPDAKVIAEDDKSALDGRPAYHCLYRFKHPKAKKGTIQRVMALAVDGMLVSLTASRTAGEFPELDKALATMCDTFKFN
jgi:hypothetical protein